MPLVRGTPEYGSVVAKTVRMTGYGYADGKVAQLLKTPAFGSIEEGMSLLLPES